VGSEPKRRSLPMWSKPLISWLAGELIAWSHLRQPVVYTPTAPDGLLTLHCYDDNFSIQVSCPLELSSQTHGLSLASRIFERLNSAYWTTNVNLVVWLTALAPDPEVAVTVMV
jgi:hypothetical protein